jgi:hypothetical protein
MNRVIRNLPFILPLLLLLGALGYALWYRDLPQADGRITGDFEAAHQRAVKAGVPLLLAVDQAPH